MKKILFWLYEVHLRCFHIFFKLDIANTTKLKFMKYWYKYRKNSNKYNNP